MIFDPHAAIPLARWRVELGHHTVEVESRTAAEAIDEARRRFRRELPRLWDVIETLAPERFRVARTS